MTSTVTRSAVESTPNVTRSLFERAAGCALRLRTGDALEVLPFLTAFPLSIVTDFLGSGKTTLIAALLKQPDVENVAVIVNEFGAVGVDDAIPAQAINPKGRR